MKPIKIQVVNFLPHERIMINANSLYEGGYDLGNQTKQLIQNKLQSIPSSALLTQKKTIEQLLREMERLAKSNTFVIDGVNWLQRYMQAFYGFTKASGITLTQSAYLQSFADMGCQTIFVQNTKSKDIQLIHIEENSEDEGLIELHKLDEGLPAKKNVTYDYRLVNHVVGDEEGISFYYPGLCWAGGTFGINNTKQSFIAIDTLLSTKYPTTNALWASALAFMLFDAGRIEIADEIISKLRRHGIGICGGYALHLCELDTKRIASYECSNTTAVKIAPQKFRDIRFIAQTNYPMTEALRKIDLFTPPENISSWDETNAQFSLEVFGRTETLTQAAKQSVFYNNNKKTIAHLLRTIADPRGDIETHEGTCSISGFVNIGEAGYVIGAVSDSSEFLIGKLAPPPRVDEPYYRFYDVTRPETTKFAQRDLLTLAKHMINAT